MTNEAIKHTEIVKAILGAIRNNPDETEKKIGSIFSGMVHTSNSLSVIGSKQRQKQEDLKSFLATLEGVSIPDKVQNDSESKNLDRTVNDLNKDVPPDKVALYGTTLKKEIEAKNDSERNKQIDSSKRNKGN